MSLGRGDSIYSAVSSPPLLRIKGPHNRKRNYLTVKEVYSYLNKLPLIEGEEYLYEKKQKNKKKTAQLKG